MNLLTGKIISRCKVIKIPTTQEVIYIVETIAKKDSNKPPLKLKDRKEEKNSEDVDKNNDDDGQIKGVEDEYEEEYEPTI